MVPCVTAIILGRVLTHSQSSRESSPGLCRNSAARKRVFSSLNSPFRHFIFPVYLWVGESGKSPWYPGSCRPRFYKISNSPTPFSSNLKQCREFSPPQGQRIQSIPLYSPTYPPGWPGVLPLGQADDMCIRLLEALKDEKRTPGKVSNFIVAFQRKNKIFLTQFQIHTNSYSTLWSPVV